MKTRLKSTLLAAGAILGLALPAGGAIVDGLVNYWDFNNNLTDSAHGLPGSDSSVADNGTFAGANGTAGIAYGSGLFGGNGIALNGAAGAKQNDGYVSVTRSADTLFGANATGSSPNTMSLSMWVTVDGNDTSWQTMISHGEGGQYRIARRDASITNAGYAGGSSDIPGSNIGADLSGGGWHHIIGISEGGASTRLWVDGSLVATGLVPIIEDTKTNSTLNLHIGANPDTGVANREWWGQIDDVAQWNRVLSEAEISEIWGAGPGSARSLGALIPEPASALLSLFGLSLIIRRRR